MHDQRHVELGAGQWPTTSIGSIGVDQWGKIHARGGVAVAILQRADGLIVRDGWLRAWDVDEDARLKAAIRDAVLAEPKPSTVALQISRNNGQWAYQVVVLADETADRRYATVLVSDPTGDLPDVERLLIQAYGLTAAEGMVAGQVVRGSDLRQVADGRGVSVSTVRVLLKRVFQKTGVRRQVDLVRLVLGGALAAGAELETRGCRESAPPRSVRQTAN